MPVSIEVLERKLKFLQEHSPEELRLAQIEFTTAKKEWDNYQEDHGKYAKIAKSITVFRSDRYKSCKTTFKEAAAKFEKLKAESQALGIESGDTPEDVEFEIEKIYSRVEADDIRNTLFQELGYEACRINAVEQAIKNNKVLTPPHRQELLREVRELAEKNEQRALIEIEIPAYCYDKLKNQGFSDRLYLFESLYRRLNSLSEESDKFFAQYCKLEQQFFIEQELKDVPSLECLKTEYARLTDLIDKRYGGARKHLGNKLLELTKLRYEQLEKKLLREQELQPLYKRMKLELSYRELIDLKPEERAKKLEHLCGELGEDYADVVAEIQYFYYKITEKINQTVGYEQRILSDWNEEVLKDLPEEEIEKRLCQKLELIAKMFVEECEIKIHIHCKIDEIAQHAILDHRIQHFPVFLWSLKTKSERKKYCDEFESALPLVVSRHKLVQKLEWLYRHTEAEIQLAKMAEALKMLEKVSLDIHLESQMDVPFQEAQNDFDKLGFTNFVVKKHPIPHAAEERLLAACNKLCEKHALILEENRFIRAAVEDLGALQHLSFEAQERSMPWIAGKWFRVLRTDELLYMLGVEALKVDQVGNFSVGSCSYELRPFQFLLLKNYTDEALKQFQAHQGPDYWLSKQIKEELITVQEQISHCLPS